MISREEETKMRCNPILQNVYFNSAITNGSTECYNVLPPLVQGVANYQRLGDRVKPKLLRIRGYVGVPDTTEYGLSPEVHVFVVSSKSSKSYNALNAGGNLGRQKIVDNLIDLGNGTEMRFDGTVPPSTFPLNTKLLKVHKHKRIHLSSGGNAASAGRQMDRRWVPFSIKIKAPASLIYDDQVDNSYPTNFAPVLMVGYCYPYDRDPDVIDQSVVVSATTELLYDDA